MILASVVAGLLLVGVLAAPFLAGLLPERDSQDRASDRTSDAAGATPLTDVEKFAITERDHTEDPVDYEQTPPAGGKHRPTWLDCGVYDDPVPNEYVVHDLEHGTVWITYDPDEVDAEGIAALEEQLPDNGILSPYPDLPAPVVVTVWGTQLRLSGPEDTGLKDFIGAYSHGETAPEPMASCHGGTRDPESGTTA